MKKRYLTKLIAVTCSLSMCLTGCSVFTGEDVTSYPLVPYLTTSEVIDYYAKSLDYDAIISRDLNVHETTYETYPVQGEKAERLKQLVDKAEDILAAPEYEITEENLKVMSPNTYEYIRGFIDNETLTRKGISKIEGALGYYFVDVDYEVGSSQIGSFTQMANLIGLNGIIYQHPVSKEWLIDTAYMQQVVNKLNEYYFNNTILKEAKFNELTGELIIETGHLPENLINIYSAGQQVIDSAGNDLQVVESDDDMTLHDDGTIGDGNSDSDVVEGESANVTAEGEQTEDEAVEAAEEAAEEAVDDIDLGIDITAGNSEDSQEMPEYSDENSLVSSDSSEVTGGTSITVYNSITSEDRKIQLDIDTINRIAGSSLKNTAQMPPLYIVYNIPEAVGITGYGIANAGGDGLKVFGFNRDALAGTMTLRYVFKDASNGSGEILGTNVYCTTETITTGINTADNNVLVPEFLMTQFQELIERADRIQADYNLPALMSGNVYEDMGVGVLRGYKENGTAVLKHMSTIRQVVDRDTANNSYVLEVETTTVEGAKDVDCYGTYRDKAYVVVQQQGTGFKIIDWCRISREMSHEAPINPDSTTIKRLVALNLAGEIPEDSKDNIKKLLSDLYTAGTNRKLHTGELQLEDGTVINIKGMYECFQSDRSILSEEKFEYANSSLRNQLLRKGADTQSIYTGVVTEWIGGYDNQAELTTEELITYTGTDEAYYMQVYYLVSNLNDVWVIDERTILDEYKVTEPNQINDIKSRVGQ